MVRPPFSDETYCQQDYVFPFFGHGVPAVNLNSWQRQEKGFYNHGMCVLSGFPPPPDDPN
jgi:hypothetical protein